MFLMFQHKTIIFISPKKKHRRMHSTFKLLFPNDLISQFKVKSKYQKSTISRTYSAISSCLP